MRVRRVTLAAGLAGAIAVPFLIMMATPGSAAEGPVCGNCWRTPTPTPPTATPIPSPPAGPLTPPGP